MPRPTPPRRRLSRVLVVGFALLSTALVPAVLAPEVAAADEVFNCYGTPFSEATYLSRYPDVAAAVRSGDFASGCAHFAAHGHAEGRSGKPDGWQPPGSEPTQPPSNPTTTCYGEPFVEDYYLARYPDVREAVAAGVFSSGCDHFSRYGYAEGRSGNPNQPTPQPTPSPTTPGPGSGPKPTAAVALGDSFVSGEGAGDYLPVRGRDSDMHGFPGWTVPNGDPYFCHRSANASIFRAQLDGIDQRFDIACSGGRPVDWAHMSSERARGRNVDSQKQQLLNVTTTNDIDLLLIGLGSNNSTFTFGDYAGVCATQFISDAWFGELAFLTQFLKWLKTGDGSLPATFSCDDSGFADDGQLARAGDETYGALRDIVLTLREHDPDRQHRIVLQDYTNPLPLELHPNYHTEASANRGFEWWETDERDDQRDKFRGLGSERYEGGCPIHRESLAPSHRFSERLGAMVARNADRLRAEFPDEQIVYLNVQKAFDGRRLCETSAPVSQSLATPIRVMSHPDGGFRTNLDGLNKGHLQEFTETCGDYYQTCQEGWHPNAEGHGVLGKCLAFAARTTDRAVRCSRTGDGTITDR